MSGGVIQKVKATYIAITVFGVSACILIWSLPLYNPHYGSSKYSRFVNPWVEVSPETRVYIFSAYLDERNGETVVAIGMEPRKGHPVLHCLLGDGKGHTMCLEQPVVERQIFRHCDKEYCQYLYMCNLSASMFTPEFVSFSQSTICLQPSPWIPVTLQMVKKSNPTKSFGIFFGTPVYKTESLQFIVETIEMKRILGAEKLTIYIHNASLEAWNILEDYSREGVVEVLNFTLPINVTLVYNYATLILLNDCAYRNMYQVKYLFFNDLDEVVVPLKHQNWYQMMENIDKESIGSFVFWHVLLQKDVRVASSSHPLCNSTGKAEGVPRIISYVKRSTVFPIRRTKFIIKPTKFEIVSQHYPYKLLKGYSVYNVPHDIALLYHYREPTLHVTTEISNDTGLRKYFPELKHRIQQRLCKFDEIK